MIAIFVALFVAFAAAKTSCCLPDAWEGLAQGYDKGKNESFFEMISYDHKFEAMRVDRFEHFRTEKHFHHSSFFILRDRKDMRLKQYTYDRRANSCVTRTDSKPFPKLCVRENHHQEFKFTIGLGYPVVYYGYDQKDGRKGEIVVSEHGCAPISGNFFEHHHWEANIAFWDVKLGIGNPIVFELPAACL